MKSKCVREKRAWERRNNRREKEKRRMGDRGTEKKKRIMEGVG